MEFPQKPLLICVVGPTAIGKTSYAIALAKAFNSEIISSDSRQFFKEMTIGTAVPSTEELAQVPHHFIQSKSIYDSYSVGDFEREALALLEILFKKNNIVIMAGGSGLYMDAVLYGLDEFPEVDQRHREDLNNLLLEEGIEVLQEELKRVDPQYANEVDLQNPQRVIRALEVYRSSGKLFSSFRKRGKVEREFNSLIIGLNADREIIYDRINQRVDQMMANGLVDEAKVLLPHKSLNALQTVGYRELFEHFEGKISLEEAIEEIKKNTRRFAKRQGTWFRKNPQIQWFSHDSTVETILDYIKNAHTQ